jgi:hypothetical protein
MAPRLEQHKINIILVQIDEAHSDAWPVAIPEILGVEQPKPQQCFQDRVDRANSFVAEYAPPYPIFIDGWNNEFAELYQAWPDKYYCLDANLKVIAKSEYHKEGHYEAKIIEDYTNLLETLMQ